MSEEKQITELEQDDIEFVKEMKWQLKRAKIIQKSILPDHLPDWNCINFAARYIALDEIGGDYYDLFPIKGDKIGLLIADVSGHGIPAALVTTMAKVSFGYFARYYDKPDEILDKVNQELIKYLPKFGAYLTAFLLVIDKDLNIEYTNAGHQHAIRYINETNAFEYLDSEGLFIGAFESAGESYEVKQTKLEAGDRIILYTDGIVEAKNKQSEEYGYERFEDIVTFSSALTNDKLAELVVDDIVRFSEGEPMKDDVSILILEVELKFKKYKENFEKFIEAEKNNDTGTLLELAEEIMIMNPDNLYVKFILSKYFYNKKNYAKTKELLLDYVKRNEENYLVYYMLGNIHYMDDNYHAAINAYHKCHEIKPDFAYVYNNIAAAYIKIGEKDKAINMLNKAKKYAPDNEKIANNVTKIKTISSL